MRPALQRCTRGVARLTAALADRDFRAAAAEGLATLARGSSDRAVLTALANTLEQDNSARMVAALVQAVTSVGGALRPILEKVMARVDPNQAMTVYWRLNGIAPKDLAERLAASGQAPRRWRNTLRNGATSPTPAAYSWTCFGNRADG